MERLNAKQQKAAILLGCGASCAQVARDVGVAVSTLANWRKDSTFCGLIEETLRNELSEAAATALQVLKGQLASDNPYVAQNAARDLLTRYENAEKNRNDGTVEIVVHGMPELGMPE